MPVGKYEGLEHPGGGSVHYGGSGAEYGGTQSVHFVAAQAKAGMDEVLRRTLREFPAAAGTAKQRNCRWNLLPRGC